MKTNLVKAIVVGVLALGLLALGLLALGGSAMAAGVPNVRTYAGFIFGSAYRQMSQSEKQRYVAGAFDGMLLAPQFAGANLPRSERLEQCGQAMNLDDGQLVAIVDKYLADHPEYLGYPMNYSVYNALDDACNKTGHPIN